MTDLTRTIARRQPVIGDPILSGLLGREHLGWADSLSGHRIGAQRWPGAPPLAVGQRLHRVVGALAASLWRFPCWSGHLVVSLRGLGLLPSLRLEGGRPYVRGRATVRN